MSEQTEKLIKIIMPDLLRYLEMRKTGEIIPKRLETQLVITQRETYIYFLKSEKSSKKLISSK